MLQSSIGWIDFSEKDRRKMMEAIAPFKQRDPRQAGIALDSRHVFRSLFY